MSLRQPKHLCGTKGHRDIAGNKPLCPCCVTYRLHTVEHYILYDDEGACPFSWSGHINLTAGEIYSKASCWSVEG